MFSSVACSVHFRSKVLKSVATAMRRYSSCRYSNLASVRRLNHVFICTWCIRGSSHDGQSFPERVMLLPGLSRLLALPFSFAYAVDYDVWISPASDLRMRGIRSSFICNAQLGKVFLKVRATLFLPQASNINI